MNSSTSRRAEQRERKEEIIRRIRDLNGELDLVQGADVEDEAACQRPEKELKRKAAEEVLLAPNTPSPKKRRKLVEHSDGTSISRRLFDQKQPRKTESSSSFLAHTATLTKPAPSKVLANLASIHNAHKRAKEREEADNEEAVERSTSFDTRVNMGGGPAKRDCQLALIEELEPGPYEFASIEDDPEFEKLEPHSGIRLVSRTLPHSTLSSHLLGRFYLSPSKLYSIIRLSPSKGGGEGYDVPVPGDWVTIAVVAERGPIRFTRAPVGIDKDEDEGKKAWHRRGQGGKGSGAATGNESGRGKKYVTLKLIDFGAREGARNNIRGDAFLNLLLFEADGFDLIQRGDDKKEEKVYRGGSNGAFERMMDVREGDVVGLLNPRVLKPYQRASSDQSVPHPQTNVLALSPTSASSILVLGRARDLGMCAVRKKDGKICGSWCDLRATRDSRAHTQTAVCEYHVLNAVRDRRAGRNEFAIGTSSLSTGAKYTHKHAYDPAKKWGLQPSTAAASANSSSASTHSGSGATYVLSGHVVTNSSTSDSRSLFISETMGREGQARAKRVSEATEEERKVLTALRKNNNGKGKAEMAGDETWDDETIFGDGKPKAHRAYPAELIKSLGFDPASSWRGRAEDKRTLDNGVKSANAVQDKLDALEATLIARKDSKREIELGRRPGKRVRSGVVVPTPAAPAMVDLDEL